MTDLLIHIGYHKTGTTWLQRAFFAAPNAGFAAPVSYRDLTDLLIVPDPFEYDAQATRQKLQPEITQAQAGGLAPVFSVERLSGMPLQGGYDSKELADRLADTFPEARILIVIREQTTAILSNYRHFVRHGGTMPLRRFLSQPHGPLFSLDYFQYHRLIAYYFKLFGEDKVRVLLYEQFQNAPEKFINQIASFCGLDTVQESDCLFPFETNINPGESGLDVALQRRLSYFIAPRTTMNQTSLFPISNKWFRTLQKYLRVLNRLVPSNVNRALAARQLATIANVAGDCYVRSNDQVAQLIDVNLGDFGYRVTNGE